MTPAYRTSLDLRDEAADEIRALLKQAGPALIASRPSDGYARCDEVML